MSPVVTGTSTLNYIDCFAYSDSPKGKTHKSPFDQLPIETNHVKLHMFYHGQTVVIRGRNHLQA